jgi:hypothetical protein
MSTDTGHQAEAVDWLRGQLRWEGRLRELCRAGGIPPSPEPLEVRDAEVAQRDTAPATVAAAAR